MNQNILEWKRREVFLIILEGEKMSSYEEPKDFYDIDSYDAKHKIKAFKQINFLKERVLVEVQVR